MRAQQESRLMRLARGGAYAVIILAGLKLASPVLGPVLVALLLAYGALPFPNWLIHRFKLKKSRAILVTTILGGSALVIILLLIDAGSIRMRDKLPVYADSFRLVYDQAAAFMTSQGLDVASFSITRALTPDRALAFAKAAIPEAGVLLSDGLLVSLLAFLFLIEMAEEIGAKRGPLAERLTYYGGDVQRYIGSIAKTTAINAAANLVILLLTGVDFPILWCTLYFFLNFIPTIGFITALVPPTLLALLMYGWQRALLVACGLILTNTVVDNLVSPMFLQKSVEVSFLEITVSLVFWAFLLGPLGAILAVPLTLSLKKFIEKNAEKAGSGGGEPGGSSAAR